jgi:hypothetical protein
MALCAFLARIKDHKSLLTVAIQARRLEESLAKRCSIAGTKVIDMLAPEAAWAMVTVRSTGKRCHGGTAVLTRERLFAGDEWHELELLTALAEKVFGRLHEVLFFQDGRDDLIRDDRSVLAHASS